MISGVPLFSETPTCCVSCKMRPTTWARYEPLALASLGRRQTLAKSMGGHHPLPCYNAVTWYTQFPGKAMFVITTGTCLFLQVWKCLENNPKSIAGCDKPPDAMVKS